jgi:hypothetical protein
MVMALTFVKKKGIKIEKFGITRLQASNPGGV